MLYLPMQCTVANCNLNTRVGLRHVGCRLTLAILTLACPRHQLLIRDMPDNFNILAVAASVYAHTNSVKLLDYWNKSAAPEGNRASYVVL